jgi:DHA2 family multidrug resistance protein
VQSATATPPPLQGGALALGSLALALATFMNVLDTTIVNVSIPSIAGDLGVAPDQGTWAITSFGVSNAISMPLTGWLTQRYGQVRLFTTSVLLFVVASFLCGLAPTLGLLIVFRVLQGAVAGPMIPLSQSLLLSSYPKSRAGSALAMWSVTTLVAPVVGPLLGGWITDNIAWPWIFYINVPVGLAAAAGTWLIYRGRETPTARVPIDGVGLALLVLWVGALQVMLDQGKDLDWFASREIVVLGASALVALCLFVAWELMDAHPVVDLRLFARRNFWAATVAMALGFGAFFGNLVLLPLWLQRYMGYTATLAGLILAPIGALAIVLTPAVGKSLGKVDARVLASASFAVQAVVLLMRSHFNTEADFVALVTPTVVQGAGMAAFLIPLISLSLAGLEPERIPAASGLFNFARISAGSFGTSLATTWWDRRASLHHAQLVEHLTPYDSTPAIALAATPAGDPASTYALLDRMVSAQASMLSANDVFYASALLFLLLIPVIWLTRPARSGGAAPIAGAH